jgi:hypothetical protein
MSVAAMSFTKGFSLSAVADCPKELVLVVAMVMWQAGKR